VCLPIPISLCINTGVEALLRPPASADRTIKAVSAPHAHTWHNAWPHLHTLDLANNQLSAHGSGISSVGELVVQQRKMERLVLSYNLLLDAGVLAFCQVLTQGTSASQRASAAAAASTNSVLLQIDSLCMEGCGLGELACQSLVDLLLPQATQGRRTLSVRGLKLSNNSRVSDQSAMALLHLRQNEKTWLMLIEATNCNISPGVLSAISHLGAPRQWSGVGSERRHALLKAAAPADPSATSTSAVISTISAAPSRPTSRTIASNGVAAGLVHTGLTNSNRGFSVLKRGISPPSGSTVLVSQPPMR
jgi:hypothetical protein